MTKIYVNETNFNKSVHAVLTPNLSSYTNYVSHEEINCIPSTQIIWFR